MNQRVVFAQSSVTGETPIANSFISHETKTLVALAAGQQGPAGASGVAGVPGPQGIPGLSGASYVHTQAVPDSVWPINHGLGRYPSVTVVDSSGSTVVGNVEYVSANQVTVRFNGAFGGAAYLN